MTYVPPTPTPGSPRAVELGCLCPVLDNGRGVGLLGGEPRDEDGRPFYAMVVGCPLHWPDPTHDPVAA